MPDRAPTTKDLVRPAIAALGAMRQPSGLVCYEVVEGAGRRGESLRYTLIVLLGLLRARDHGDPVDLDTASMLDAADRALSGPEATPGDVGLRLWVDARAGGADAPRLVERLALELDGPRPLPSLEGMEVAWIAIGLAHAVDGHPAARGLLTRALDQLLVANRADSGLLRHFGDGRRRARFPNFATQIYGVLALAVVARLDLDARAPLAARRLADVLLELQLPDGGWPWLYDADRGRVVEPYEVYSVHQHGMAPMALDELAAVTGDERYADAARRGERWLFGSNELGQDMAPLATGMTYRSIRRRRPLDRVVLYANTAATLGIGRPLGGPGGGAVEVNRTCRPYELGWLIEAAVAVDGA